MIKIQGKGVSDGVVSGPLYIYRRAEHRVIRKKVSDTEAEWARFQTASQVAIEQLGTLAEKAREEIGDESALLFETHQMMIEDSEFTDKIKWWIFEDELAAESALMETAIEIIDLFESIDNEYMRARVADYKDIVYRLLCILCGDEDVSIDSEVPVILAGDEFSPSETMQLDKSKILGFVTTGGSSNSHTAILARTLGIPAVIGAKDVLNTEYEGKKVYLDGETGEVIIDADRQTAEQMQRKMTDRQVMAEKLLALKGLPGETKDGQSVLLYCNIGSEDEVKAVLENDGEGIGLFRSEFLYLQKEDYPTEEEQFAVYRAVAERMAGKRVIIRTLDIGADKQADYFELDPEENPAMGLRAIRLCLTRPEVFRTQLRAVYRASAYGKIAIMFPMITGLWEVRECKRLCQEVREELKKEGIPFREDVELGIMIETPAAVMISDLLAPEVDFFSVGTNDLTQYMLACDRQCAGLERFVDPHHRAVLRAIKMAADSAHREGKWIGICGELAADPELTDVFLAMGIDELSVAPGNVLPLRHAIREMDDPEVRLTNMYERLK